MFADIDQLSLLLSILTMQNLERNISEFESESILIIISCGLKHIEKGKDSLQVTHALALLYHRVHFKGYHYAVHRAFLQRFIIPGGPLPEGDIEVLPRGICIGFGINYSPIRKGNLPAR